MGFSGWYTIAYLPIVLIVPVGGISPSVTITKPQLRHSQAQPLFIYVVPLA